MPTICFVIILFLGWSTAYYAVVSKEMWYIRSQHAVITSAYFSTDKNDKNIFGPDTFRADSLISCCKNCFSMKPKQSTMKYIYIPEMSRCLCAWKFVLIKGVENVTTVVESSIERSFTVEVSNQKQDIERFSMFPCLKDCSDWYENNHTKDGIYTIQPGGGGLSTLAYCSMASGGWTVIQRRGSGSNAFHHSWSDYIRGFGPRLEEYWLGLENIHQLTQNGSEMKFVFHHNSENCPVLAVPFDNFKVGDGRSTYALTLDESDFACTSKFRANLDGKSFGLMDNDGNMINFENKFSGTMLKTCYSFILGRDYPDLKETCSDDDIAMTEMIVKPTKVVMN